jgi:hypothetical protein
MFESESEALDFKGVGYDECYGWNLDGVQKGWFLLSDRYSMSLLQKVDGKGRSMTAWGTS